MVLKDSFQLIFKNLVTCACHYSLHTKDLELHCPMTSCDDENVLYLCVHYGSHESQLALSAQNVSHTADQLYIYFYLITLN